ncbi:MAG: hypothetical protein KA329_11410 [Novosphingobium sp.]|nr:hypothetical protein [Novosphingobium sp.]
MQLEPAIDGDSGKRVNLRRNVGQPLTPLPFLGAFAPWREKSLLRVGGQRKRFWFTPRRKGAKGLGIECTVTVMRIFVPVTVIAQSKVHRYSALSMIFFASAEYGTKPFKKRNRVVSSSESHFSVIRRSWENICLQTS